MFKQECERFLDSITQLRAAAIQSAISKALQEKHVGYEKELTDARDSYIAEEAKRVKELVAELQAELEKKRNACFAETENAINAHKKKVIEDAEQNARVEYDNFILGVAHLADNANIC